MLSESDILESLMKWRTRISAAAFLVVRDTHVAEDIFQNVTIKAITRNVNFETESKLTSWAFITARREGIDWLRKSRRETAGIDSDLLETLESEWMETSAENVRVDALRECLEASPPENRRLLHLRYFEGHRCDVVAEKMGIGLWAVYKRLSRLHESLRACVEGKLAKMTPRSN